MVVPAALKNGQTLFPQQRNANPVASDGTPIPLWDLGPGELTGFVDHCESSGVTFVATEWAAPDLAVLASDPRVALITCLRDPLERFLSNFYYDYYFGNTSRATPGDYANSGRSFTMYNYYCRILSRHDASPEPVGPRQYERARRALSLFDCRVLLERPDALSVLADPLGWSRTDGHDNRTAPTFRHFLEFLAARRLLPFWRPLTRPRVRPSPEFEARFRLENEWDYRLCEEAGRIESARRGS